MFQDKAKIKEVHPREQAYLSLDQVVIRQGESFIFFGFENERGEVTSSPSVYLSERCSFFP